MIDLFSIKYLTLLAFITINLASLFLIKEKISAIIAALSSCLAAILICSLLIQDPSTFKEMTLALIIYCGATLFLLSLQNDSENNLLNYHEETNRLKLVLIISLASVFFLMILILGKTISEPTLREQRMVEETLSTKPTQKNTATISAFSKTITTLPLSSKDQLSLYEKLSEHFLLKHYSAMILLIIAVMTCSFILSYSKKEGADVL
jgi:hypothetical protein